MGVAKPSVSAAILAATAIVLALWCNTALADNRVALVIGNASCQNVPKLPNPSSEANAIAQMFKNAGFAPSAPKLSV